MLIRDQVKIESQRASLILGFDAVEYLKAKHKGKSQYTMIDLLADLQEITRGAPASYAAKRAPSAQTSSTAPKAVTEGLKVGQLRAIARDVFPTEIPNWPALDKPSLFAAVEKSAYQAHLTFPGMGSEAELSKKYWRRDASKITGAWRTSRTMRQKRIISLCNTNK